MPSRRISSGLALVSSSCCLLAILSVGVVPVSSRAVSRTDPNTCTVCIKGAPHYVPHTSIQWSQDGRICVKKTFSRHDDWLLDCEGSKAKAAELEALTDVPSCEVCHGNSASVEAWHKMWTEGDGTQCASAEFVPKAGA